MRLGLRGAGNEIVTAPLSLSISASPSYSSSPTFTVSVFMFENRRLMSAQGASVVVSIFMSCSRNAKPRTKRGLVSSMALPSDQQRQDT
jgi:hypothetical protein